MLVNSWIKTTSDEDIDDPDEDGDHWYYFGSKGKKTTESKKIAGKTYYFNEDGEMQDGCCLLYTSTRGWLPRRDFVGSTDAVFCPL